MLPLVTVFSFFSADELIQAIHSDIAVATKRLDDPKFQALTQNLKEFVSSIKLKKES